MKIITIITLLLIISCTSSGKKKGIFKTTDKNFVLLSDSVSPNGSLKYLEFCYDIGGSGYSRVFWAVISSSDSSVNLSDKIIPDGYKIIGWSSVNELIIEKWEPYYTKSSEVELGDGMILFGAKIKRNNSK